MEVVYVTLATLDSSVKWYATSVSWVADVHSDVNVMVVVLVTHSTDNVIVMRVTKETSAHYNVIKIYFGVKTVPTLVPATVLIVITETERVGVHQEKLGTTVKRGATRVSSGFSVPRHVVVRTMPSVTL